VRERREWDRVRTFTLGNFVSDGGRGVARRFPDVKVMKKKKWKGEERGRISNKTCKYLNGE